MPPTAPPPIYLDHHATTPVDPRVLEAMLPWFGTHFANAASFHAAGAAASRGVETARELVARLIGADPKGIVFTSGATESNHLVLHGFAAFHDEPIHIITAVTEHPAILAPCERLESEGHRVTRLKVNRLGQLDLDALAKALTQPTGPCLVSLMAANNEIGTFHDLAAIGTITRAHNAIFHCDASQAAGIRPINVDRMNIDALSCTAHKLYGPKGIGALYLRRKRPRVRLLPPMVGGGQEQGFRPGTLNVPGIVGFGEACRIANAEMPNRAEHLFALKDHLQEMLGSALAGIAQLHVNGDELDRHPGNLNVRLAGIPSRWIRGNLSWIACSSGSACASAMQEPSHVLRAIGLTVEEARESLRFGIGKDNTREDIDRAVEAIAAMAAQYVG